MEEKKEKTIEKAREYFHRHWYRKASLSDLIAEIGISKPTFYNYFKNKEELFFAVMLSTYNEFLYEFNRRARNAANSLEKLDLFIRTYRWFLDTYPIFRDLHKPGNDLLPRWVKSRNSRDIFAEGVETIRGIVEEGQEEGTISRDLNQDQAALFLYFMVTQVLATDPNIYQRKNKPEYSIDLDTLIRITIQGLLDRDS
jgi:AcrR family transcriptional regulator